MKRLLFKPLRRTRKIIKYSVITSSIGLSIAYGIYSYDAGFKRQCDFYIRALPVLAHYKLTDYKHKYLYSLSWFKNEITLAEEYQALHGKYAQTILDVILELRGLYVKAGQFATSRPDVVPDVWIDKLRSLQVRQLSCHI